MKHFQLQATFLLVLLPPFIQACGPSPTSSPKEAWDTFNRPGLLDVKDQSYASEYVYNWQDLPLKGELTSRPWSDDYWPTYRGGISYRWHQLSEEGANRYTYEMKPMQDLKLEDMYELSPAEKLDIFISDDKYPNTMGERLRTNVFKTVEGTAEYDADFTIPTWEGLCHAWAPASLIFQEPRPVTVTNDQGRQIPFGASDVKALLAYLLHRNSTAGGFLGQRCNKNFAEHLLAYIGGRMTLEEYEKLIASAECRDLNAGAFHVVLSNQIARLNEGIIADVSRDHEVWNQPVFKYESTVLEEKDGASPGAARGTVREISVETSMSYGAEATAHWEVSSGTFSEATKTYRYRLELDAKGQILGGEWLDEERPDFFWEPGQPQYYTKEDLAIKKIYEASLGLSL